MDTSIKAFSEGCFAITAKTWKDPGCLVRIRYRPAFVGMQAC